MFSRSFLHFSEPHQHLRAGHQPHAARIPEASYRRSDLGGGIRRPRLNIEPGQVSTDVPFPPSVAAVHNGTAKVTGAGSSLWRRPEQRLSADRGVFQRRMLSFTGRREAPRLPDLVPPLRRRHLQRVRRLWRLASHVWAERFALFNSRQLRRWYFFTFSFTKNKHFLTILICGTYLYLLTWATSVATPYLRVQPSCAIL